MQIDSTQEAIQKAMQTWCLKEPVGYLAVAVATENGAAIPTWLVVKNKTTGVHMLTNGQALRSFDARLLRQQKDDKDQIVFTAPNGTLNKMRQASRAAGMPLGEWIVLKTIGK